MIKLWRRKVFFVSLFCALTQVIFAADTALMRLPAPNKQGGKPLMQALQARKSQRDFSDRKLPLQVLSDLLWAANGVNRAELKGRTAPSAHDAQEITIYVALDSGLYFYDPFQNSLVAVSSQDIRAVTGKQDFVKDAPVNLIFVADLRKAAKFEDLVDFYTACDAGFISQNVYLYCASEGLATVVRHWFDEKKLASALNLSPDQKIILAQTVGYAK